MVFCMCEQNIALLRIKYKCIYIYIYIYMYILQSIIVKHYLYLNINLKAVTFKNIAFIHNSLIYIL